MITVDTNILVYAHRAETRLHRAAAALLKSLADGNEPWVLLWPCLYEFLRVVTHPRIFDPPTPLRLALDTVGKLLGCPTAVVLAETTRHNALLPAVLGAAGTTGNHVFDGHIAALMREHAIDEIVTTDRDFHRFKGIRVRLLGETP
jgi:toxin-antitoxin system PIN domain toxin